MTDKPRDFAIRARDRLKWHDTEDMRALIVDVMTGIGGYDEWMDVFKDDTDMLNRFKANKHKIRRREPLLVDYTDRIKC